MSGGKAFVAMVQATDLREGDDSSCGTLLYGTSVGTVLVEGEVGPGSVVVVEVGRQDAAQMASVENDDVIETLAADRADEALDIGVLSGRSWRGGELFNPHRQDALAEARPIAAVAIAQ